MKIARCTATGLITAAPAVQNRASSEAVVHEDEFQVEGLDVEEEDVGEGEAGELQELPAEAAKIED